MNKTLANILKLTISLGIGVLIVWLTIQKLTDEQLTIVKNVFARADYKWVIIGPLIGMLSNVVRAERWKMLLNSIGYEPKRMNVINSVYVMYAGNLIFPRLGEVTRCTLLYKSDNIPVDKSIGTMVLERMVDMVTMLLIGAVVIAVQYQLLFKFLSDNVLSKFSSSASGSSIQLVLLLVLVVLGLVGFYLLYRMRSNPLIGKVWGFIKGILDGLLSIGKLKNPLLFIFYSLLIWAMYIAMLVICLRALPETAPLSIWAGMATVFFGGFAFIVSQGGIGAYPLTVAGVLGIYGVPYEVGFAFGWLVWSLQTIAVIAFGVLSFILVSRNFSVNNNT